MKVAISLLVFFIISNFSLAQWSTNPAVNNPICTTTNNQQDHQIISDGNGGAIIAWTDYRNVNGADIYVQKINSNGVVEWATEGIPICVATYDQKFPVLTSDNNGGAIISWTDYRNSIDPNYGSDIFAQKINSNGIIQWLENGVLVCLASYDQMFPEICSDGNEGAIIVWKDFRNGFYYDVFAQRINSSGSVQWATSGLEICIEVGNKGNTKIISDGSGGAIITWEDHRFEPNASDIFAQRINSDGISQWNTGGEAICFHPFEQRNPQIINDGNGGAIITWEDFRNGQYCDIGVQKINTNGVVQWLQNGILICNAAGEQSFPEICSDGSGGAIITWQDYRNNIHYDIYAIRISSNGTNLWPTNGIEVCSAVGNQLRTKIVSDGIGGAIITWNDNRWGQFSDICAQKMNSAGFIQWAANGVAICSAVDNQIYPHLIGDEERGAIITWLDYRNTQTTDIYASKINADGYLGNLPEEQFTEPTSISLTGVGGGSVAWGDYDNDGDLDILLTGSDVSTYPSVPVSKIYKNNGNNTFTEQTSINLIGVSAGSAAWGDYDNDGNIDILLTGSDGLNFISRIYRNNGDNSFTEQTSIVLPGVYFSSVAWGDYDNDGDLDILLTGSTTGIYLGNFISRIYRNNGDNTFTEQTSISLPGVCFSSVAWGDYDNDQDLDIILAGLSGQYVQGIPISKIYRNNNDNTFTEQTSINLRGLFGGSAAWGDYDNDGDLDILLTADSTLSMSSIYRNNGNNTFTEQTSISLIGVVNCSVAWGDYNNDGDLDIILSGYSNFGPVSKIYRNNGNNTFTEQTSISLTGVENSSVAWGDYDNDGDLDILLTGIVNGNNAISKIYRNNNLIQNTIPTAPTNILATVNGEDVTLSWNKSTDNETPQNGLRYNLVIGTSSGAMNTLSPMSDRGSGYRRVINLGNTNHNNTWTVKDLEPGNYFWSVQAIDNCFAGSLFAVEESFTKSVSATNWIKQVGLKDAGGTESSEYLIFGQKPNATNGIDPLLGEYELPAVPSLGIFDARFILPTVPEVGSLIDIRDSIDTEVTWTLTFQPGPVGYPMTFEWDTLSFPPGTFFLTDTMNGTIININMRNQGSYIITDPSITSLYIKYQRSVTAQLSVAIQDGWNVVSIPGLHPVDQNVNTWWQYRDMNANVFKYAGGYLSVTEATPGIGYWMKHAGTRTYNTGEEWPAGGIQIVTHEPINVNTGWNLIGGYEDIVSTANLTTTPPNQITGPVYKYSGGYQIATTLDPGYGYWIKLLSACQINIPDALAKGSGEIVEWFNKDWGRIILTDASGMSFTLYAIKGEANLDNYKMPPLPPSEMFDIRFSSGRIAEDINSSVKMIDMSGVTYPLTVRVEGMDIRLMDETGKNINVNLKSGEDVVISDATINKLMVSGEMIPAEYALEQNYPNPFNPSTVIEFSLPEDVANVKLSIYNALGEKVAELVNTSLTAGNYKYQWNASNVATGMYIYELRTDKFVSVKKMVLLK